MDWILLSCKKRRKGKDNKICIFVDKELFLEDKQPTFIYYILSHEILRLFAQKPNLFRHMKSNVDFKVRI